MRKVELDVAKEFLDYNPETGIFIWKVRDKKWFSNYNNRHKVWNKRFSGEVAGELQNKGYVLISINSERYLAHRLAWLLHYGEWPQVEMDHINHIRNDNRIKNLRLADNRTNKKNIKLSIANKSGVNGVSFDKRLKKWIAGIGVDKKRIYLGCFDDKEDAVASRLRANIRYGFHPNHGKNITIKD